MGLRPGCSLSAYGIWSYPAPCRTTASAWQFCASNQPGELACASPSCAGFPAGRMQGSNNGLWSIPLYKHTASIRCGRHCAGVRAAVWLKPPCSLGTHCLAIFYYM